MSLSFLDTQREKHHLQARLIASGRHTLADVARIVETSETKLGRLLADPSFRNLISRYRKAEGERQAASRFNLLAAA